MDFAVEKHFSKKFTFQSPPGEEWRLPDPSTLFTGQPFQTGFLSQLKTQLNTVKAQLNDYVLDDWHRHTKATNPAGRVLWTVKESCGPELLTQAWCKFYEIVSSFGIVPDSGSLCSLHLCEAPGAFVTALNHFLHLQRPGIQWQWLASTMNPHYEGNPGTLMVSDDRFISLTLDKWSFGHDLTGDLLKPENCLSLIEQAQQQLKPYVSLVTADGSIDCQEDPGEQETLVAPLLLCEAFTALHVLHQGGCLVLKSFTWFEGSSVCLLYLLACCFQELHAFKPGTSREGNSEVYLVGLGFHGVETLAAHLPCLMQHYADIQDADKLMFREELLPESFLSQVHQATATFYNQQVEAIQHNIELFETGMSHNRRRRLNELREAVAQSYVQRYQLQPIPAEHCIVGPDALRLFPAVHLETRSGANSHTEQSVQRAALRSASQLGHAEARELLLAFLPSLQLPALPTDTQGFCWLQVPDEKVPEELQVGCGFARMSCSKFCRPWLLQLHLGVWDICTSLGLPAPALPQPSNDPGVISVAAHGELGAWLPHLLHSLLSLTPGAHLELLGISLITCLNVGLLRLLTPLFTKVALCKLSSHGSCVLLQGFLGPDTELLVFLQQVSETQPAKGSRVLSLTPTPALCRGEMYERVVQANHSVIRMSVLQTLELLVAPTLN